MRRIVLSVYLLLSVNVYGQLPVGFNAQLLTNNLTEPTSLVTDSDGEIYITEKKGSVRVVKNGQLLSTPLISLDVDAHSERGLQNMVLDPDFDSNHYFYLYYTIPNKNYNRISRFTADGEISDPSSEVVILELDPMEGYFHNGGAMIFGNDDKLYITTGDGHLGIKSQELTTLLGKALRINKDGSIPEDNPFYNLASGKYRSIYALGLRNPFTAAKDPLSGEIFLNDVGHASFEEVNVLEKAKNYGWPFIEGFLGENPPPRENYKDPLFAYSHDEGCAIVGATFYSPLTLIFPEKYHNKYFFSDYCSKFIKIMDPLSGQITETMITNISSIVGLLTGIDGALYVLSVQGELWIIKFSATGAPTIAKQPESKILSVGETAEFEVIASGAGDLNYQWERNGDELNGATGSKLVYENVSLADNLSEFKCRIFNEDGEITSNPAILQVTVNRRPEIFITEPLPTNLYQAGDTIVIKGNAVDDEDGDIKKEFLSWKIDFHHDTHTHPVVNKLEGVDSLTIVVPAIGETSSNVWYRIHLTATDSEELSNTVFKDVFPHKSKLRLQTDPPGILLNLDGQPIVTPTEFYSVVNMIRSISAPETQIIPPYIYVFESWGNSESEASITFNTPSKDSIFTAKYKPFPLGNGDGLLTELFNASSTAGLPDSQRVDQEINFDWGLGSPRPSVINLDHFSIRWTGFLEVPVSGLFNFCIESDDGARLWIDDELVIDNWFQQFASEKCGNKQLDSASLHSLRLDYFDYDSIASVKLSWGSEEIPKSIIPHYQFYANHKPEAYITSPSDTFKMVYGESFLINGFGWDIDDGDTLRSENMSWRIDLHMNNEVLNILPETSNVYSIDQSATWPSMEQTNIYYKVYLTVNDSHSVKSTVSKTIYPNKVTVNLQSNVPDVDFILNGQVVRSQNGIEQISGTIGTLEAPLTITEGNDTYIFNEWPGNGPSNPISFTIPKKDTTIVAQYELVTQYITSINETLASPVRIYPNPASQGITLKWITKTPANYTMSVINAIGQIVISKSNLSQESYYLDISPLNKGYYILLLSTETESTTSRFVKQ